MGLANIWQWSETPASNTEIDGIDITGTTGKVKDGDNAIRELMSQIITVEGKGTAVASASTVTLGTERYYHITGTTTITDIDFTDAVDGRWAWLIFDGAALTLTHNATTLQLPGGVSIVTEAGDRGLFIQDSTDNVICLQYVRATKSLGGIFKTTVLTSGTAATHTYDTKAKAARIRMVGGGGGSGGVDCNSTTASRAVAGGGGGGYVEHYIASALPATATYTIGAAGTAGSTAGTTGGSGGDTTYSDGTASLTASGGQNGAGSPSGIANFTVAPARAGGAATGGNVLNIVGGSSEPSFSSGTGISAACIIVTGSGGSSLLGPGGAGSGIGSSAAADVASNAPAGGYGGGASGTGQMLTNGTGVAGAAGAGGVMIIEEFY